MVDVKEATKLATEYFTDLFGDKYSGLTLEEVEISEDEKFWYITIGYNVDKPTISASLPFTRSGREYKSFKIECDTGKVLSMKIRKID
ncbi:MAG: hypothetical protein SCARUB_00521 [Candidatus Scalindua rubra]|uniref:PepSY domain-containing protein n=1 Tax=Candidatus Scalindua rubra TaxID=1872076 RepID=A0A1E3XFL6_9BACT|nr:MAG: hypothetical protein SCARUB_00521 [Candidatus Scalindua rubra]